MMIAVDFMAGGYASARLQQPPLIIAYSIAPWVLAAYLAFLGRQRLVESFLFGLAIGLQFLHLVQVSYLTLLLCLLHLAVWTACGKFRVTAASAGKLFLAASVALLISLPQWLPFVLVAPYYTRHEQALSDVVANSLDSGTLLTLLLPNHFRAIEGTFFGSQDITQAYLYFGAIYFPVFVIGVWVAWRRKASACASLALCILLGSLVYSLGTATPFYSVLYTIVPGVSLFRRPVDALFLFNLAASVVTAYGFAELLRVGRMRQMAFWPVLGGMLALLVLNVFDNPAYSQTSDIFVVFALLAAATAVVTGIHGKRWSGAAVAFLSLCGAAELTAHSLVPEVNARQNVDVERVVSEHADLIRALQQTSAPGHVLDRFDTEPDMTYSFMENWAPLLGIATINGYNSFRYSLVDDLVQPVVDAIGSPRTPTRGDTEWYRWLLRTNILRSRSPKETDGFDCHEWFTGSNYWICRRVDRLPLVLNPQRIVVDKQASSRPWSYDPREEAVLETQPNSPCTGSVIVRGVRFGNAKVAIDLTTDTGGLLVLTEPWHPYWYAKVDGERTPILKANGINRAVCVPPGSTRLVMKYEPYAWRSIKDFIDRQILHRTPG